MRERLKRYLTDFEKALNNLDYAVSEAKDDLDIDGAIKRFELCYELAWKLMKEFLADRGIFCKSPRECFKQAVISGLITDDTPWLNMIEDRNILVHTYTSDTSREVFENIQDNYIFVFIEILKTIKREIENE